MVEQCEDRYQPKQFDCVIDLWHRVFDATHEHQITFDCQFISKGCRLTFGCQVNRIASLLHEQNAPQSMRECSLMLLLRIIGIQCFIEDPNNPTTELSQRRSPTIRVEYEQAINVRRDR